MITYYEVKKGKQVYQLFALKNVMKEIEESSGEKITVTKRI